MRNSSKSKPIKSAETLAVLRALSNHERITVLKNPDNLAKHFLSAKYRMLMTVRPRSLIRRIAESKSPGSYYFTIIRTKHFDNALLNALSQGVQQIVILGAGYDSRAYRFQDKLSNIRVFELDFPATQSVKKSIITRLYDDVPKNVKFVPIDFNTQSVREALYKSNFRPDIQTIFLWEGVSYYLSPQEVGNILSFVSNDCTASATILFDYATRSFVEGDHSTYGGIQVAEWLKQIGEPFLFGINYEETKDFLASYGLDVISDMGPMELEKIYLGRPDNGVYGRTLGHVRMVHAKNSDCNNSV